MSVKLRRLLVHWILKLWDNHSWKCKWAFLQYFSFSSTIFLFFHHFLLHMHSKLWFPKLYYRSLFYMTWYIMNISDSDTFLMSDKCHILEYWVNLHALLKVYFLVRVIPQLQESKHKTAFTVTKSEYIFSYFYFYRFM